MNSGQKTAVSLILTVGLFVAFIFTYYANVFTKIEAQFYEPERIQQERNQLLETSKFCNSYIQNILDTLGNGFVKESSVKSFLSQTPSESEVTSRVQLSGELFSKLPGLEGFRIIDKNGRDVHYSSYSDDVLKQSGTTKVYKNFTDIQVVPGELKFDVISIPESDNIAASKITFNSERSLINFSFPIYDKYNVFRGVLVFNFRTSDLERELVKANIISVSDAITLVCSADNFSGGIVIGMPKVGREFFAEPVLKNWQIKSSGPDKIVEAENDNYWVILSDYSAKYISVSESFRSDYFELPTDTRILICVCVFITVFLFLFLLLSIKHDDMVVIRSRIKKIQFALIAEYLDNKQDVDWQLVSRQIEGRKADLFKDVKKSLGHKGKKHSKEVDALLNKSWDEILSAIGNKQEYQASISKSDASSAEIKRMLEEVLSTTQLKVQNVLPQPEVKQTVHPLSEAEEIEEIEEIEEAETLDEVEPIEEVETLDEVEPLEEVETLDEVEPLEDAEPVDEIEEIEEVEEAETLDEVEPVEEVETLDEVEPLEDAEPVDEIEEIEEVEEAETLDEVEQVEDVEVAEEVEEPVEAVAEPETLDEAVEAVEEVEALDEVEAVEEVESLDETEPVEEVAEPAEEIEEVEEVPAEPLDEAEPEPAEETEEDIARRKAREELYNEKLEFGIAANAPKPDDSEEMLEEFEIFDPDFSVEKELEPAEEKTMFSMTSFGNNTNYVADLVEEVDTIVEVDGIYTIADNLEMSSISIDKDFKKLVDSVLSV